MRRFSACAIIVGLIGVCVMSIRFSSNPVVNYQVARRTVAQNELKQVLVSIQNMTSPELPRDELLFQQHLLTQGNLLLQGADRTGAIMVELNKHRDRWDVFWQDPAIEETSFIMARLYYRNDDRSISRIDYFADGRYGFISNTEYVPLGDDYLSIGKCER